MIAVAKEWDTSGTKAPSCVLVKQRVKSNSLCFCDTKKPRWLLDHAALAGQERYVSASIFLKKSCEEFSLHEDTSSYRSS